jgi:hypothetical protein
MRYMMFITHADNIDVAKVPQPLLDAMGEFVGQGFKDGSIVDTAGLQPTKAATRVRLTGGKLKTTDGPFTEAKEVVGGYAIIEAKSKKDAIDYATKFMELHRIHWPEFEGSCEVRPLEQM